ncbi:Phospholipid-binding protein [Cesiribacter andamanensis AMV16]|uniref:Phospholipid-binding protein n=2 Tax=Cesiribacter TaxID=1133570 RepID=M7NUT3_9BACT|nr:Phospholipid-binding protein [Cesiribacter andamanensis AMV16]
MKGQNLRHWLLGLALFSFPFVSLAQNGQERKYSEMKGFVNKPGFLEASPERLKSLKLPLGFTIEKWADGFEKPRMLAVGPQGQVYVSDPKKGEVLLLQDSNKDGKSDARQVVMKQDKAHGLAVHEGQLYVVTVREVYRAPIQANGSLGTAQKIISDLPDGGQHPNRTLYFGPDGKMYITVGSTCNACDEPNEEAATILQFNADGSGRTIWARGLRNTIGMDWHPQTRQLWGMDHGIDWFGDDESKEELNLLEEGRHYGWPYIYEKGTRSPKDTPEEGWQAYEKR